MEEEEEEGEDEDEGAIVSTVIAFFPAFPPLDDTSKIRRFSNFILMSFWVCSSVSASLGCIFCRLLLGLRITY